MSDEGEDNPPNETTGETVIEGTGGLCEGGHTGDTVRWLGFATITGEGNPGDRTPGGTSDDNEEGSLAEMMR